MNIYDEHLFYVEQLSKFKKLELEKRNEIIKTIKGKVIEGKVKNTVKVGQDEYELNAEFKLTKNIDESELDTLWNDFTDQEKDCIRKKPKLKAKEYKALLKHLKENEDVISKLLDCIIEKPSQTTLKINKLTDE